jgi:hypothetical protein
VIGDVSTDGGKPLRHFRELFLRIIDSRDEQSRDLNPYSTLVEIFNGVFYGREMQPAKFLVRFLLESLQVYVHGI